MVHHAPPPPQPLPFDRDRHHFVRHHRCSMPSPLSLAPLLPSPPSPSHPLFATAASCSSPSYRRRHLPTKPSIHSLSLSVGTSLFAVIRFR
ncbi:hypothetical protein LINPERHAP2_LOCUS35353 [Linum perenne]